MRVHRVERIKYPEVFDKLPQGVCAGVISRPKVARESSGGLTYLRVLKGRWREIALQKLSSSGRTLVHLVEVVKEERMVGIIH
jgi:hypothetical protein